MLILSPQAVVIICLSTHVLLQCRCNITIITSNTTEDDRKFYHKLLDNIHEERPYDSILLILHQHPARDNRLELLYQYPKPKVILVKDNKFLYKKLFNTDILTVIVMQEMLDMEMFAAAAESLNYIRQQRIVIIAVNMKDSYVHELKIELLSQCRRYNMTNVLLHLYTAEAASVSQQYHILKPFPLYHWDVRDNYSDTFQFYPRHWHNMHNISLVTLSDQTTPSNLLFEDSQRQLHINGIVARMILLFGERYNVTFVQHRSFKLGKIDHFTKVTQMVAQHQLDIPMALQYPSGEETQNMTDIYELNDIVLMVPRAQPLTNREIFMLLLDGSFFKYILICSLTLSISHTLLVYVVCGDLQRLNILISATAFPGVLGLSFVTKYSLWTSLKIVYFLIALVGINISSLFAGHMNTYFTYPPYHRQIYTYKDLMKQSNVKILMYTAEAELLGHPNPLRHFVVIHPNISHVLEQRNNFNITYAYFMTTPSWVMLDRKQQYHSQKAFHAPEAMKYLSTVPYGFMLPFNSPYKEPLSHLINRIHDVGLKEAWERSTFSDMLKLKQISLRDPNPTRGNMIFSPNDFYWIWIIWLIGLGVGTTAFVAELLCFKFGKVIRLNIKD